MRRPAFSKILRHWQFVDLHGIAQLATDATLNVTDIVEGVHQSVLGSIGLPGARESDQGGGKSFGKTRGLTGLVYKSVRGVTRLVGHGLNQGLGALQTRLPPDGEKEETRERAALLAAMNGVMGDRLTASQSPFATRMQLFFRDRATRVPSNGKILLIIHGLCMNDLQWQQNQPDRSEPPLPQSTHSDHGAQLAAQLGYTEVYLRYNSGLHVSQNGQQLAVLLQQMIDFWPHPITELSILVHSMGGLVTRSACHQAALAGMGWLRHLKNIVFLGTPHHGAPLERAGNWIDLLLGSTPWSKPFTRLAQLRSCGITDLRYGLLLESDWHGRDRFCRHPDQRTHLPLPAGVACYSLAAALASEKGVLAERLLGDGLVPLRSALGQHDEPGRNLQFTRQAIVYQTNHMALLYQPQVTLQVLAWLKE
jgi:hypothetical protein